MKVFDASSHFCMRIGPSVRPICVFFWIHENTCFRLLRFFVHFEIIEIICLWLFYHVKSEKKLVWIWFGKFMDWFLNSNGLIPLAVSTVGVLGRCVASFPRHICWTGSIESRTNNDQHKRKLSMNKPLALPTLGLMHANTSSSRVLRRLGCTIYSIYQKARDSLFITSSGHASIRCRRERLWISGKFLT